MNNYGKAEALIGTRRGNLEIIKIAYKLPRKGNFMECRCDCGNVVNIPVSRLLSGGATSCPDCGRKRGKEKVVALLLKHGDARWKKQERLYRCWKSMRSRCYVKGETSYPFYGGRGITVCDEWRNSYEAFRDWAHSAGYNDNLTIERNDPNENYCPENCCWITKAKQSINRRTTRFYTINGETLCIKHWADKIGVNHVTLLNHEKKGDLVPYILERLRKD